MVDGRERGQATLEAILVVVCVFLGGYLALRGLAEALAGWWRSLAWWDQLPWSLLR